LASDKSNQGYGAVAQLLGTMVAGQTYTISADAFGGNGNVAWIGTAQLQSDAGISPTVYATSTSGGLAAGVFAADGLSASYTAGPADEGQPLWIKFSVPVPPEANTAMRGGIDNVRLTVIGAPKLTIAQRGNQVTISWPAEATGFVLECTDQLPATSWIEVPGVIGNFVTETIDAKAKFYRLRK
jgi:hypothetical protein